MRKLRLGQLVLWQRSPVTFREYYYDLLVPWEHYVPLEPDLSNLEQVREWIDTPEGQVEARRIKNNALRLMETRFRREDILCYATRLFLAMHDMQAFELPRALEEQTELVIPPSKWLPVEPHVSRAGQQRAAEDR
jgi:hypothetical protein